MASSGAHHIGQSVLVFVVLAAGVLVAVLLVRSQPDAAKQPLAEVAPLVEVLDVQLQDVAVQVRGYGTVRPGVAVDIVPQVAGTVLELHPSMRAGGFFSAGEVLIRIDPTDYTLAIDEAQAELEQARAELVNATASVADFEARLDDARTELARQRELRASNSTPQRELDRAEFAFRQADAQLRGTKAMTHRARGAETSAQTRLKIAMLKLERTKISVPFSGRVMTEHIDIGQFVDFGQKLASVYGTTTMEIVVPLEDWQLAWFDAPGASDDASRSGTTAQVMADFAGRRRTWKGRVARIESQIDPTSRMVNVVVETVEPFSQDADRIVLMPGMFVDVLLDGRTAHNVVAIPRRALRLNQRVWVVVVDRLRFQDVEVVRHDRDVVYVRGLESGQQLATSDLDIVVDGMLIRTTLAETDASSTHKTASDQSPATKASAARSEPTERTAIP